MKYKIEATIDVHEDEGFNITDAAERVERWMIEQFGLREEDIYVGWDEVE